MNRERQEFPDRRRTCKAVAGYMELGLPDLALEELNQLHPADLAIVPVRELRLAVLIQLKRWEEAVVTGHVLCADAPECRGAWLHTAFALHELGRTRDACSLMLGVADLMSSDPLFHYNLGCYLAVLGDHQNAEVSLRTAFAARPSLRDYARNDRDLASLGSLDHL
jgi:Flp pilus assembly protein TadD